MFAAAAAWINGVFTVLCDFITNSMRYSSSAGTAVVNVYNANMVTY
jgi:hypothetical protein